MKLLIILFTAVLGFTALACAVVVLSPHRKIANSSVMAVVDPSPKPMRKKTTPPSVASEQSAAKESADSEDGEYIPDDLLIAQGDPLISEGRLEMIARGYFYTPAMVACPSVDALAEVDRLYGYQLEDQSAQVVIGKEMFARQHGGPFQVRDVRALGCLAIPPGKRVKARVIDGVQDVVAKIGSRYVHGYANRMSAVDPVRPEDVQPGNLPLRAPDANDAMQDVWSKMPIELQRSCDGTDRVQVGQCILRSTQAWMSAHPDSRPVPWLPE